MSTPFHRDARITATLPFTAPGVSPPLTLDHYAPSGRSLPAHPAVLILHGGGFVGGNSRSPSEAYAADFLTPAGYAVFSSNYRLAPAASLPDMVEDVQRAIRFLRHHAARFHIDPNRIALAGGSAGGYLSNMAGLLPGTPLAPGDPAFRDAIDQTSAAVQAVVTLFGISDLATLGAAVLFRTYRLLGPTPITPAALAAASPITHIHSPSPASPVPPFLLVHGDRDTLVPLDQSTRFHRALLAAGVSSELLTIAGGPHATHTWHTLPTPNTWERHTIQFLNRTFQHTGIPGPGILPR